MLSSWTKDMSNKLTHTTWCSEEQQVTKRRRLATRTEFSEPELIGSVWVEVRNNVSLNALCGGGRASRRPRSAASLTILHFIACSRIEWNTRRKKKCHTVWPADLSIDFGVWPGRRWRWKSKAMGWMTFQKNNTHTLGWRLKRKEEEFVAVFMMSNLVSSTTQSGLATNRSGSLKTYSRAALFKVN